MYSFHSRGRGPRAVLLMMLVAVGAACADTERSITAPADPSSSLFTGSDSAARKPADPVDPDAPVITIYREQTVYLEGTSKVVARGLMQCSTDRAEVELVVGIKQTNGGPNGTPGRGFATGKFPCTPAGQSWQLDLEADNTPFTAGTAMAEAATVDPVRDAYVGYTTRRVKLIVPEQM